MNVCEFKAIKCATRKEGKKLREIPHVKVYLHFTTVNTFISVSLSEEYMKAFELIYKNIHIYGMQCDILDKCKHYTILQIVNYLFPQIPIIYL